MNINSPEVRSIVAKAFPEYRGKRYSVEAFRGPMRLTSYWDGGSRDYYAAVPLIDGPGRLEVPENGTPFTKELKPLEVLPAGTALVRYTMGRHEAVCVYVNAENLTKLLPPPVELTDDEKLVLTKTRGLKSSYAGVSNYRFVSAQRETGITAERWEAAKASCIARGLLNRAGAITDAGRNVVPFSY